uniref:Uncharacterized protein n=1 Tax=Amphimedon queenslandica TaxID=400682 RepID=A0A1X7SFF3_AMPQE
MYIHVFKWHIIIVVVIFIINKTSFKIAVHVDYNVLIRAQLDLV